MLVLNVIFKCAPDKREELRELISQVEAYKESKQR